MQTLSDPGDTRTNKIDIDTLLMDTKKTSVQQSRCVKWGSRFTYQVFVNKYSPWPCVTRDAKGKRIADLLKVTVDSF